MNLYKDMYLHLFREISHALDALDQMNFGTAKELLKDATCHTEEMYMDTDMDDENIPA